MYMDIGQGDEALKYATEAVELLQRIGDNRKATEAMCQVIEAWIIKEQPEEALQTATKEMQNCKLLKNMAGEATMMLQASDAYVAMKKSVDAKAVAIEARGIFKESGDAAGEAKALEQIVNVNLILGNSKDALQVAEEAVSLQAPASDDIAKGNAYLALSKARLQCQKPKGALTAAKDALECYQAVNDESKQGLAWLAEARAQDAKGKTCEALQSAQRALQKFHVCSKALDAEKALNLMIHCHITDGAHQAALQLAENYLNHSKGGLREQVAVVTVMDTYDRIGDADGATKVGRDAMVRFSKMGDGIGRAEAAQAVARLNWQKREKDQALELIKDAMSLWREGYEISKGEASAIREEELRAVQELASAVERKDMEEWNTALQKLDKMQGITQEDLDAALGNAFSKDPKGTKAFLEEFADQVGAAPGYTDTFIQKLEEATLPMAGKQVFKTWDMKCMYESSRLGVCFGPRFQCTKSTFKLCYQGENKEQICNTAQPTWTDAWEVRMHSWHLGLVDAALTGQCGFGIPDDF